LEKKPDHNGHQYLIFFGRDQDPSKNSQ